MEKFKLADEKFGKDYVFVLSNTKYLSELNDVEAKVLFDNGDPRIVVVEKAAEPQKQEIAEGEVKEVVEPKTKKSDGK